jgi:hypothetical protein
MRLLVARRSVGGGTRLDVLSTTAGSASDAGRTAPVECRTLAPPLNPPQTGIALERTHTGYEPWAMRPLSGCDHRFSEIRICGDHAIARIRTNILPDGSALDFGW